MRTAYQVRNGQSYFRQKPERNPRYLAFVRRFACAACESTRGVEAAHTGPHGLGQKSSDMLAIPLCFDCHRGDKISLHALGPLQFARERGLDFRKIIKELQARFTQKEGR